MATKITKQDLEVKKSIGATGGQSSGMFGEVTGFMRELTSTIDAAKSLLDGYQGIMGKLRPEEKKNVRFSVILQSPLLRHDPY